MSDEIKISKKNLWMYSTFALLVVVIIGGILLFGGGSTTGQVGQQPTNPDQQLGVVSASIDDDPILGDKDAPVEIIEFSDYQCPFCRKFWTETLPSIKSEYIDTGKIKLVYRDFPLTSIHPSAQPAAEAAECVREQGGDEAYFEMHDKIFSEQNILDGGDPTTGPVRSTVQFSNDDLKDWAKELGYAIDSCLDSGKFRDEVLNDLADAQAAGGRGTPHFVINGIPVSGAQPFSAFQQVIEG